MRTLLEQKQSETDERKLEREAEALKAEEAALLEQTDLKSIFRESFHENQSKPNEDDDFRQNSSQLNQKEMLDVMGEVLSNAIEANTKLILNKVGELVKGSDEKIVGTQRALIGLMSHISVNETKNNHSDYDAYKDDIAVIMSKTSGLSTEQAYTLAKAQKTEKVPGRSQIESERPDTYVSRSQGYDEREYSDDRHSELDERLPRNPRREFKEGVSKAIEKVVLARRNN